MDANGFSVFHGSRHNRDNHCRTPPSGWTFQRAFVYRGQVWRLERNVHDGARAALLCTVERGTIVRMELMYYSATDARLDIEVEYDQHKRLTRKDYENDYSGLDKESDGTLPEATRRIARRERISRA